MRDVGKELNVLAASEDSRGGAVRDATTFGRNSPIQNPSMSDTVVKLSTNKKKYRQFGEPALLRTMYYAK